MPIVSMFYGIIVSLYFMDKGRHKKPHIHVRFHNKEAVVEIPNGRLIEGGLPSSKMKLLAAWIEIHKDELVADWELAARGESIFPIEPLR
jgi:hypothetical protein